jgi:pimeloyl-ACP methyl ester carboxylesterase
LTEDFSPVRFTTGDGLSLYARVYGAKDSAQPTVVCLAGLTRNSRDFDGLALYLSGQGFRVITIDSRGRGRSDSARNPAEYTVITEAEDVVSGLAALGVAKAAFIGTSRGGLVLHMLNSMRPAALRAVVLNDIGPEIELDGLMLIRRYLQNAPIPKDWAEAVEIQKGVHGKLFSALSDEDWMRHARAIYRDDGKGQLIADYDPRIAETLNALTPETVLPAMWPQFSGFGHLPLMVIRGENSRLLSDRVFREMGITHPGAELVTVKDQAHAPHLDTAGLPERIAAFLKPVDFG